MDRSIVNNPAYVEGYKGQIPFALVAWREKNNRRSDENYGDLNVIRNSLADRQWHTDNQVPVTTLTEEEKLAEMTERQVKWDEKKAAVARDEKDEKAREELRVFEELYCVPVNDGGDAKVLIEPKFSGNAGFRRARSFFGAMIQRATKKADKTDPHPETTFHGLVPVRVVVYKTIIERLIDQQMENELQGQGTVPMNDLDKLKVTHDLYIAGCKEADVRKLYSSATGQKAFGICRIDEDYPALKIYARFTSYPKESPDYIPWRPVRHNELVKMNNRTERMRKIKEGYALKETERGLPDITEAEVDKYFRDKAQNIGDGGNASKIMSKDDINSMSKTGGLIIQKATADAIVHNTTSGATMTKLLQNADSINTITEMVIEGNGDTLKTVAPVLKTEPELFARVSRLIASGRGGELRSALDKIENPVVEVAPAATTVPAATTTEPVQQNGQRQGGKRDTAKSGR